MSEKPAKKLNLEILNRQEDRILNLLREERKRTKEKFPLPYALLATFGVVCIIGGLNKIIDNSPYLSDHPFILIGLGLFCLIITGAVYRKLD